MKLTTILLTCLSITVYATGYAQKVNINVNNASVESVCKEIKKQTGYFFLYDKALLQRSGTVSLDLKNTELRDALDILVYKKPLSYKIIDKTIILSDKVGAIIQKDIPVKGKVTAKGGLTPGDPLIGVLVSVKNSAKAVTTNVNGEYYIVVPEDATLVFSFLGFEKKEVAVNGLAQLDVALRESVSELNEVIVTGYGTSERKENQVGSAFQVTAKDLERKPLDRIDRLLEGVVPGLQFETQDKTASSARPRYQTRIRGESSIGASNEPLWVVDGIPLNTGNETNQILGVNTSISPLSYINPSDIESVTVLKDATATSIYGANGANGVILITTKKGLANVDQVNYSFRTGINLLNHNSRLQVLNANQYRELYNESLANNTSLDLPPLRKTASTDWYDAFFRTGITTQHDLSLRGGSQKTRYYVSGSYYNEKPILIANNVDRFATRINFDQNVNKKISLFFNLGASYNINKLFNPGNSYYINIPINPIYNEDGTFVSAFYNKLADAKFNDDNQRAVALNGNIGGKVSIINGLDFTTINGIDYTGIDESRYQSENTFVNRNDGGYAYKNQTTNFGWTSTQRLNYQQMFGNHVVSALLGGEATNRKRRSVGSSGWGFANDYIREVSYAPNTRGTSSGDENASLSYFGQFNYSFKGRYHLIGSFRDDGNSDFGSDVQWAKFRSIGAAWTISHEKFWNIKPIDFAKFKLSYGTNGNSRYGNYQSKGIYSFDTNYGYNGNAGAIMTSGENPSLSWETTYILNGGISLGFFNSRILLEVEAYRSITDGALNSVDVSRTSGFTRIYQNSGGLRNSGVEITLNSKNLDKESFKWETAFNLALNRNKVIDLYNGNDKIFGNTIQSIGYDSSTWYLIRWAGVDPRDGNALWYDANGNITRVYNVNNRVKVGNRTPDFYGGMTNSITYKNFMLRVLLIYNVGGYDFSNLQRDSESDGRNLATQNQSKNQLDRWQQLGDLALAPKTVLTQNADFGRNSTRFLHKKTNLRLHNVSLNYQLPAGFLNKIKVKNAGLYLQADNVGIWTPYKRKKGRNDYRNSFTAYPQPLVISTGLNVGF